MLLKAVCFAILCGLLGQVHFLYAMEFLSCYEWQVKAFVVLNCNAEIIQIKSVRHGLSWQSAESFCSSPVSDEQSDCFYPYNETEVAMFRGCNMQHSCNVSTPFLSLNAKCPGVPDETRAKYVIVKYDCVQDMPEQTVDMELYGNSNDANILSSSALYLLTENYPSFIKDTNICELTIQEGILLQVMVMELHQKRNHEKPCLFKLIVTNKMTVYSECTSTIWEAQDSSLEFTAQNSNLQIQIALRSNQQGSEAKTWLQLRTYNANNKSERKAGFVSLRCGSQISLWPEAMVTTPMLSTTTAHTSTASKASTETLHNRVVSTTSTLQPGSTDIVTQTSTGNSSITAPSIGDTAPKKLKDDNLMPIIAGAVAGGLVLLVIVIIIVILVVRKHQNDRKPAKQLDVIDAWDNQSVIDAAKKSAQAYKMEEPYDMSRSLSPTYPQTVRGSFQPQTSYIGQNDYAEVPSLPGSRAPSELGGVSNKGYENDAYYTGDIEGDLYSQVNKHHGNRSLKKKNGSIVMKDSQPSRISQLYAKPVKKQKSASGFDDPTWAQNGGPDYGFDDLVQSNNVQNHVNAPEDIYGYTTTLD